MAGMGPAPKPSHLRARTNRKSTAATLEVPAVGKAPAIPNPDNRTWHELTLAAWKHAWRSPMASQWLETDVDALGQLAILWDEFYKKPSDKAMAEIRLQRQCFGLTPLDRSRLQWEVSRGEEAEQRQRQKAAPKKSHKDPRAFLKAVP